MEIVLLISLVLLPFVVPTDPAPGLTRSKTQSRRLECERLSAEIASRRYPGRIVTSDGRGDFTERSVVVCRERLLRPGLRTAHDEAILSSLDARVTELAIAAESLRPDLADRTWLVEAYYPSAPVTTKISFAAKNALMNRGLQVSDRVPILATGDVEVLTRMAPDEAYPAACQRYLATGGLREDDVLFALISRDRRETNLHAGLCAQGQWVWLK
ncbi:MAG TPA: hypothetical protein ENK18_18035 [Deltaproteobacteria bacterium]|nr:hypothetical protein [Deltaproteobacteria bacterium]